MTIASLEIKTRSVLEPGLWGFPVLFWIIVGSVGIIAFILLLDLTGKKPKEGSGPSLPKTEEDQRDGII